MVSRLNNLIQEQRETAFGSRSFAFTCLNSFLNKVEDYAAERNFVLPGHPNTSLLSPFLRTRLILEREVCKTVLDHFTYEAASKYIEEICWRTYWKGWLEQHPSVWSDYLTQARNIRDQLTDSDRKKLESAENSRTGIEAFDAWNEELLATGYLHNHARMWYASIWIFTLKLPWSLGAEHFMRHLLDGDPASNTLSWRWVAGLHTKGKSYLARPDNIWKFTKGQFGSSGLALSAEPLVENFEYHSTPLVHVASAIEATMPSLSSSPAGLLVIPDDLSPEISELSDCPFSSICILSASDVLAPLQLTDKVMRFQGEAIHDTAHRLEGEWNGELVEVQNVLKSSIPKASPCFVGLKSKPRVYHGHVENWVESVVNWAVKESLNSVRLFRPTVGPWLSHLDDLREELADNGIQLYQYRRKWDSLHWPHAQKGFFNFKKGLKERIEKIL